MVVLGLAAAVTSCLASERTQTSQDQCGVVVGRGVSEEQAMCIARSVGLPEGIKPWTATVDPAQPGQTSARWVIWSMQRDLKCGEPGEAGIRVFIDMHDGRVVGTGPYPGPSCASA